VLAQANADEIQFVTLPEVVRTTVVRESNIPDYSRVTRVIRDNQGIYEVTVRRATDNEVLFVDPVGRLVRQQTVAVAAPVQLVEFAVATMEAAGCTRGFRLERLGAPADRASRPASVQSIRFAALLSKSRPSFPR
jgi:hypothetical protein